MPRFADFEIMEEMYIVDPDLQWELTEEFEKIVQLFDNQANFFI